MEKKNLRRLHCMVTAQTLYHLEHLAAAAGYRDPGRVIDKLVREKAVALREGKIWKREDANSADACCRPAGGADTARNAGQRGEKKP